MRRGKSSWTSQQRKAIMAKLRGDEQGGGLRQKFTETMKKSPKVGTGAFSFGGGTPQDQKLINSALSKVSQSHISIAGLRRVVVVKDQWKIHYASYKDSIDSGDTTDAKVMGNFERGAKTYGFFDSEKGTMYLSSGLDKEKLPAGMDATFVILHEFGHALEDGLERKYGRAKMKAHMDYVYKHGKDIINKLVTSEISGKRSDIKMESFAHAYAIYAAGRGRKNV